MADGRYIAEQPALAGVQEPARAERRALLVFYGPFSYINASVARAMRELYPQVRFDEVQVLDLVRTDVGFLLRCGFATLREYGLSSLRSKARFRYRMARTSTYFREIRRRYLAHVGKAPYVASIQTQSMFDGATGRFPHVIYTDHVARARERVGWDDGLGRPGPRWLALERETYANARRVFTFGSAMRAFLVDQYQQDPDHVCRAGAGPNVLPATRPSTDIDRYARRNILFVGIDWERKGGPDLVAAFARVRDRLPDATLTIIGCSPEVSVPGASVLGRLPPDAVQRHFAEAAVFCMPSRLEPFGIVYVEALHYCLPIVATNVCDIGDLVIDGENGFLVPPRDPEALAAALVTVLEDPATCRAYGLRSGDLAQDHTWLKVAERIGSALPELGAPGVAP
jgi:glycosyltransferase involved in cell wall biosynthesis